MGVVTVGITKIDNKTNTYPTSVEVALPGPWKVEGTATAESGKSIVYLAWNSGPIGGDHTISMANLPNWEFYLTVDDVPTLGALNFAVDALDNDSPPGSGRDWGSASRASNPPPPPAPAVLAQSGPYA